MHQTILSKLEAGQRDGFDSHRVHPNVFLELPPRFWSKVNKTGTCWVWTAGTSGGGYGRFKIEGRYFLSHRLVYRAAKGAIPEGYLICHTCDNPSCVNPDHLFAGTQSDNMKDAYKKGRLSLEAAHLTGESNPNAVLTWEKVDSIRALYADGRISQMKLARMFNCGQSTISDIVTGKNWIPDRR